MEDVGIPIKNDPISVKPNLSEIRTREEVNSEKVNGDEKRQKLEVITNNSPKQVGLLDNLLAKLSSPRVSNPGDDSVHGSDDVGTNDAGVGAGGGVIDKISSFFSRGDGEEEKDEDEDEDGRENGKSGGEGSKGNGVGEGSEEGGSNGASIISSLIPDGVAPASDEASILIHSVVHD